jgi:hypothetical protein
MTTKITLEDIDITCGPGWVPIIERLIEDLNAADVQISGIRALETHGRLRLHYTDIGKHIFSTVGKIMVLAEFRSMYVCEMCGKPGEFRRDEYLYLSTRCSEHQSAAAKAGEHRRPYRRLHLGDFEYDPMLDQMVRMPGRLQVRYSGILALTQTSSWTPRRRPSSTKPWVPWCVGRLPRSTTSILSAAMSKVTLSSTITSTSYLRVLSATC